MKSYDHTDVPRAEFLKTVDFDPAGLIKLHRYGGRHQYGSGPCPCGPLILTFDDIQEPSVAALQTRLDNFYRRQ